MVVRQHSEADTRPAPTRPAGSTVHLALAALLLAPQAARAAAVIPLPAAQCADLMRRFGAATGMALATREAPVTAALVEAALLPAGTTGRACTGSGRATGLRDDFATVEARVTAVLTGWSAVPEQAADGPAETVQGFRRGRRHVVFSLTAAPPKGRCTDVVLADCKAPRSRWVWTFRATAYEE